MPEKTYTITVTEDELKLLEALVTNYSPDHDIDVVGFDATEDAFNLVCETFPNARKGQ